MSNIIEKIKNMFCRILSRQATFSAFDARVLTLEKHVVRVNNSRKDAQRIERIAISFAHTCRRKLDQLIKEECDNCRYTSLGFAISIDFNEDGFSSMDREGTIEIKNCFLWHRRLKNENERFQIANIVSKELVSHYLSSGYDVIMYELGGSLDASPLSENTMQDIPTLEDCMIYSGEFDCLGDGSEPRYCLFGRLNWGNENGFRENAKRITDQSELDAYAKHGIPILDIVCGKEDDTVS